ncbi:hypothetical protein OFO10_03060 [Campylobacter sp. VBCF_06 NA8]|uniref:hypothetical protein n=1 Tax=Campylobacter sp. VBCF_06 NA8 TaxID=2983822 RepID=UPI0022E99AE4|nr:hypothetical protein [Campylobacter sp. VBCF_06 NA8]MDA3046131.1 hypothetical protein [Campylobacter sp. VBCF_06 NA8]
MIILGHELVDYEPFYAIKHTDEVFRYDNLLFKFDPKLISLAKSTEKNFSVITNNLNEILLANGAGARFIIVNKKTAPLAQKLANDYLFDAKIAMFASSTRALKQLAELGIDAVVFKEAIANRPKSFLSGLFAGGRKFHLPHINPQGLIGLTKNLGGKIKNLDTKISAKNLSKEDIWKK